jgi:hypothetical protein
MYKRIFFTTILTGMMIGSMIVPCQAAPQQPRTPWYRPIPKDCFPVNLYQHGAYTSRISYTNCRTNRPDTTTSTAGATNTAYIKKGDAARVEVAAGGQEIKTFTITGKSTIDCGGVGSPKCEIHLIP